MRGIGEPRTLRVTGVRRIETCDPMVVDWNRPLQPPQGHRPGECQDAPPRMSEILLSNPSPAPEHPRPSGIALYVSVTTRTKPA